MQLGTFSKNTKKAQGAGERRNFEENKEKLAKGVGGNPFAALEDGEMKALSARELQARICFNSVSWLYMGDVLRRWLLHMGDVLRRWLLQIFSIVRLMLVFNDDWGLLKHIVDVLRR